MSKAEKLLHPTTKKVIPIKRNPLPLPPNSLLYQKPRQRKPHLPSELVQDVPTLQHGQHIYVYNHIQTNQVVYSLTRHMNNAAALSQLPFLGKKTVPARIRKDLWRPMCLATFPSPHAGLLAYRKLREFRRLHETAYPASLIQDPNNPRANLPKKKRSLILMDQKANTVADLAAVLLQQEKGVSQGRIEQFRRRKQRWDWLDKVGSKKNKGKGGPLNVEVEYKGVEGVKVYWSDVRDAEYAQTWPQDVVHAGLGRHRYTAAWPAAEVKEEEVLPSLAEEKGDGENGKEADIKTADGDAKAKAKGENADTEKPAPSLLQKARKRFFG